MEAYEKDEALSAIRNLKGQFRGKIFTWGSGIQRKLIVSFLLLGTIPMLIMGILSYSKSSKILVDQTNVQMENLTAKGIEQYVRENR